MNTLLLITVVFLAATNGANDNFKGVATLYGSGTAGYWTSLIFGSLATLAGALSSFYLAKTLLVAFTGNGLVSAAVASQSTFALAVAGGAALTVALAAWRGLPISTTHALVGGMCGAGLIAGATGIHFGTLGASFLLPLVASPVLAMIPAWLIARMLPAAVIEAAKEPVCICTQELAGIRADSATLRSPGAALVVARNSVCAEQDASTLLSLDARALSAGMQFLFAGAVSFARGLNDTPKIAALLLPIATLDAHVAVVAVAAAMLGGGLLGARRVGHTMSHRITDLRLRAALSASFVTSLLVGTASISGLPVSTTHVSVGGLAGAGAAEAGVNRGALSGIASSWLATLPVAAALAALLYAVAR